MSDDILDEFAPDFVPFKDVETGPRWKKWRQFRCEVILPGGSRCKVTGSYLVGAKRFCRHHVEEARRRQREDAARVDES